MASFQFKDFFKDLFRKQKTIDRPFSGRVDPNACWLDVQTRLLPGYGEDPCRA